MEGMPIGGLLAGLLCGSASAVNDYLVPKMKNGGWRNFNSAWGHAKKFTDLANDEFISAA